MSPTIAANIQDEEIISALRSFNEDPTMDRVETLRTRLSVHALPLGERSEAIRAAVDAARMEPGIEPVTGSSEHSDGRGAPRVRVVGVLRRHQHEHTRSFKRRASDVLMSPPPGLLTDADTSLGRSYQVRPGILRNDFKWGMQFEEAPAEECLIVVNMGSVRSGEVPFDVRDLETAIDIPYSPPSFADEQDPKPQPAFALGDVTVGTVARVNDIDAEAMIVLVRDRAGSRVVTLQFDGEPVTVEGITRTNRLEVDASEVEVIRGVDPSHQATWIATLSQKGASCFEGLGEDATLAVLERIARQGFVPCLYDGKLVQFERQIAPNAMQVLIPEIYPDEPGERRLAFAVTSICLSDEDPFDGRALHASTWEEALNAALPFCEDDRELVLVHPDSATPAADITMFLYAIAGRVPGDDDDTLSVITAANETDARASFEDELIGDYSESDLESIVATHGSKIFTSGFERIGQYTGSGALKLDAGHRRSIAAKAPDDAPSLDL